MYQSIMLIIILIILGSVIYLNGYKTNKQREYKDDERWQAIQNQVNKICYKFNNILIYLISIGILISIMIGDLDIYLSLDRALMFAFLGLTSRDLVELIALHFYNTKI